MRGEPTDARSTRLFEVISAADRRAADFGCLRGGCAAVATDRSVDLRVTRFSGPMVGSSVVCSGVEGCCGCPHAETRLVVQLLSRRHSSAWTLLCSTSPCVVCAAAIVDSELFVEVYWLRDYRDARGIAMLRDAGLACGRLRGP